jgi:DNA uptake protein ComE-like DNA-binding protein
MKSASLTAAVLPRPIESADLLRGHRRDRLPMLTLATLSRGAAVIAVSGGAVLALAVARGPEPATIEPASAPKASAETAAARSAPMTAAPVQDVRLVYGNPDAPRGYDRPAAAPSGPPPPAAPPVAVAVPAPAVEAQPVVPAPVLAYAAAMPEPAAEPETTQPAVAIATGGSVDLNTATLEQLNGLSAGMIGRAIVRGRPYAAAQELVDRRILSRASFDKIRARVVVGEAR